MGLRWRARPCTWPVDVPSEFRCLFFCLVSRHGTSHDPAVFSCVMRWLPALAGSLWLRWRPPTRMYSNRRARATRRSRRVTSLRSSVRFRLAVRRRPFNVVPKHASAHPFVLSCGSSVGPYGAPFGRTSSSSVRAPKRIPTLRWRSRRIPPGPRARTRPESYIEREGSDGAGLRVPRGIRRIEMIVACCASYYSRAGQQRRMASGHLYATPVPLSPRLQSATPRVSLSFVGRRLRWRLAACRRPGSPPSCLRPSW